MEYTRKRNYKIVNNENVIRLRTILICMISAIGIYLGIYFPVINIIVFIIVLISILVCSISEVYCELFFLLPFTMIFKINSSSTSLYTYLTLVFALCLLFSIRRMNKHFIINFVLLAIYLFFGAIYVITDYIKILSSFILAYVFVNKVSRCNFSKYVIFLSSGVIVSSFIGMRKSSWPALSNFFSSMKSEYINGVSVNRFTGLYLDPNYYSILVIVCLVTVLLFAFKKEIPVLKALVLSIFLIIFGCLTYSKVFYLALIIVVLFALFIRIKQSGNYIGSLLLIILVLVLGCYLAIKYGIAENIIYRFSAEDISNNRFDIWKMYLGSIFSSLKIVFFGVGIGRGNLAGVGVHNYYIELWYYLGIIGSFIYIFLIVNILKMSKRIQKRNILNYSLLIILLLMFLTLGMLLSNDFIYLLMMVWIVLNTEIKYMGRNKIKCYK